jgi:hypothetical protein
MYRYSRKIVSETIKRGKNMNIKKITAAVASVAVAAGLATYLPQKTEITEVSAAGDYNYAEALQKSMFFYEVQQAGELPEWNEVSWRADSMMKEDGTSADIVEGGWFDAGDHIKFALTNAYTATVLAWGLIEYTDSVKNAGLYELYLNNLQWGLDYVAGCDEGDKVIGTIADDAFDHVWWGSPEVYMRKYVLQGGTEDRPYDEITCTSTVAQMASAMAAGYIVFKDENPELAASYLEHAESLFQLADTTRDNSDQGVQGGGNYYKASDFYDDLFYAANWMYMATGEQKYLDLCESDYIPNFATENQSTERKYTWGFCWDDVSQGAALLYAINTGKDEWKQQVYKHLEYWTTGYGGKQVQYTPDGLAWLMSWGSLRHAENTAFIALLAADTVFADDDTLSDKYNTWAKSQMDYAFGDNDLGMSYVIGMGDKNPTTVHHRGASGTHDDHWNDLGGTDDSGKWQTEYAHTLYGALEGGPNQDGTFTDQVSSYQNTEVAIDYNAGFTAALCALIDDYGGEPLEDFPPTETPKWDEFFMKASFNQQSDSYTEIKAYAMNHSAWPARVIKDLSYNYYFDISELVEQGFSIDDVVVTKGTDQHSGDEGVATVSDPIQYDGNIYYVKITFGDGRVVMPTGQSEHRSELQFRIGIPDNLKTADGNKVTWDGTNDYSAQGLVMGGEDSMIVTSYITMYDGDTLIWGTEPDGTTPEATEPTTKATTEATTAAITATDNDTDATLWGDADLSGDVNIADAVRIMSFVENENEYPLEEQGKINADVYTNGDGLNNMDALAVQKYIAQVLEELPESYLED